MRSRFSQSQLCDVPKLIFIAMPTFLQKFKVSVQTPLWVRLQYVIFLGQAEVTPPRAALVWGAMFNRLPFDGIGDPPPLNVPNVFRQGCGWGIVWIFEGGLMVVESFFKSLFGGPNVILITFTWRNGCLVDDTLFKATSYHGALGRSVTVAHSCGFGLCAIAAVAVRQHSLVVLGDGLLDVWGAAVAQLDCVLVENLVVFVAWWKVFVDECKERSAYVRFDLYVVWRVEPDDFAFALAWDRVCWSACFVLDIMAETAVFEAAVVDVLCPVELILVTRDWWYSVCDHGRELF